MPKTSNRERGFSFLELVVVLSLLTVLTAIIVPVYGDSVSAMKRRSAQGDLVALLYFVQELAVRESREVRLYIDRHKGAYWVERWVSGHGDDKSFERIESRADGGGVHYFPEPFEITRIQARSGEGRGVYYITCFPSGACDRASIRISNGRGEASTTITTTGALGQVEVTQ